MISDHKRKLLVDSGARAQSSVADDMKRIQREEREKETDFTFQQ